VRDRIVTPGRSADRPNGASIRCSNAAPNFDHADPGTVSRARPKLRKNIQASLKKARRKPEVFFRLRPS
jgi:hypothetical protein